MSNDKCLEVNKGGEVGRGEHVIIYNRVAREVLPTKVTLEQGAKEGISSVNIWGNAFQAKGTAGAKALTYHRNRWKARVSGTE